MSTIKAFFVSTALLEVGAGLGLATAPAAAVRLLVGAPLDTPAALTVARVAAGALLALGAACWLGRNDVQSAAAKGLAVGLLLYNTAAVTVLVYGSIGWGLSGIALWPAVTLHAAMVVWGIGCLPRTAKRPLP